MKHTLNSCFKNPSLLIPTGMLFSLFLLGCVCVSVCVCVCVCVYLVVMDQNFQDDYFWWYFLDIVIFL